MPLPTLNTLSFDAELVCRLSIQPISAAQQHDTRLALRLLGAAEQTSRNGDSSRSPPAFRKA